MKIKCVFVLLVFFTQTGGAADANQLFDAAINGKIERVKSILSKGVNVNEKTDTGRTALMAASFNGNVRVIRLLLAYGADVNLADNLGSTALMDAVFFGNGQLVKLLITAGADVTAVDKKNISVIEKAKKTNHGHIVKMLEKMMSENNQEAKNSTETDTSKDKKDQE